MFVIPSLALVLGLSIFPQNVLAAGAEEERLRGFAEHQDENKQFDKARQQGERGFLEEAERWENQRERDLEQEKHRKKEAEMTEESPEARADAAEKKQTNLVYEENRKNYLKNKSKEEELSREDKKLPSEAQELGLNIERPRYEYRKRAQFGGKSPSEKTASASRTGKSSSGGGNFPPPPTFDDFSRGGGSANG
ncbi:MAG TPA: hypothetical protein VN132_05880, partial [Bdellovibrio sp.]|nr:hypothetical protein [Bdellovibrio sp.]